MSEHIKAPHWFYRIRAIYKLLICLSIAALSYILLLPVRMEAFTRTMVGWDIFSLASREDASRPVVFVIVISAIVGSLGGVLLLLKNQTAWLLSEGLETAIYIAGVTFSWILLHILFTSRYAYLYYGDHATKEGEMARGLEIPGNEGPDYMDFAYFAFVTGMTFQVSDIQISSRQIRRVVLAHGILSFQSNNMFRWLVIICCPMMLCAQQSPIGLEAYRRWDLLPQQRIGVRAYMRSTYDRTGGGSDAGNFLFMNKEDENVTLDVKGQGVLYFFRANHWHGSPWHFTIDGKDNIVKETATDSPVNAIRTVQRAQFIPGDVFHEPMDWTWTTAKGADLIWTPMPFRDSLRIAYSRTFYGTGYYIYHLFTGELPVSTFDADTLMSRAGTDIAPNDIAAARGQVVLDKQSVLLDALVGGPSVIRALKLKIPLDKAVDIERLRLRITWDDASYPSVDAPLCLFFGAGTFFNKGKREYFVKGLPINIRYDYPHNEVELACYYPMPFFRQARLEIVGDAAGVPLEYEIRYEPLKTAANLSSYFHATYVDIPEPVLGQDMVWLDTKGIEGHADWSGSFAGTSFIFSHNANFYTLEGDPRFFFDDSQTPQAQGTGTEEWAGGGDYWGREKMTLPLAGHPCGSKDTASAVNDKDLIESAYRFLMADIMPFGLRAIIRFEHSEDVSMEHYEAVTYWYGLPAPSLIKTDSLDIGKVLDENKHNYYSPDASPVETLVSRYEWGPDVLPESVYGIDVSKIPGYKAGTELYPASEQDGRHTLGVSEFTVRLDPANVGVLLRRTLDYSFPNQTAEVYVQTTDGWQKVGIWYLAGSNTCMYSEPPDELAPREYHVQTSNRQFRDDEFLLPARLTKGRSFLRIRIRCIPDQQQLYPGHAFPKPSCWSELKYDVYSYVIPKFQIDSATTNPSDHVSVYPNPAGDQVNLEIFNSLTGVINVQVINAMGVTVKRYQYSKEATLMQQSISLSGLPTGLYFIRMQSAGWSETRKVLKE